MAIVIILQIPLAIQNVYLNHILFLRFGREPIELEGGEAMQGVQLVPGERLPAEVHPDRPHPREFLCMLNLSRIRIVDYDFFWIRTVIFQINRIRIVDPH